MQVCERQLWILSGHVSKARVEEKGRGERLSCRLRFEVSFMCCWTSGFLSKRLRTSLPKESGTRTSSSKRRNWQTTLASQPSLAYSQQKKVLLLMHPMTSACISCTISHGILEPKVPPRRNCGSHSCPSANKGQAWKKQTPWDHSVAHQGWCTGQEEAKSSRK